MSTYKSTSLVSVIIPFYQKEKGLLQRCVASILSQKGFENYKIIVVDDGSPVSARNELAGILPTTDKIKLVEQVNAGPGAARNSGLNAVGADSTYVALMDSDDWWEPDFLQIATQTLDKGYDLFFANTVREQISHSRFEWHKSKGLDLKPIDHQVLDQELETYEFTGDFFDYAITRSNIIATSSTIYRAEINPALRFNTRLYNGQDRLFKLSLCQRVRSVAFTPRVLVRECKGLNIFDNAQWGSPESLRLLHNYINLSKTILNELDLSDKHRKKIKEQLNESRYSMVASIVHLKKSGVTLDWNSISKTLRDDPALMGYFIPYCFKVLYSGLSRQQVRSG